MKKNIVIFLVAVSFLLITAVSQAQDAATVTPAKRSAETACELKKKASLSLRKAFTRASVAKLSEEIDADIEKMKAAGRTQGATVELMSMNYSVDRSHQRRDEFEGAEKGEDNFRVSYNMTLNIEPADKAPGLVEALDKDGYKAKLDVRVNNECARKRNL